ncbi:MAG: glycerol-3-phosphate 1-O-acyltransferase PlsY [Gemmatimonadales bacterium]
MTLALWLGASYLLGAIPTSYLVARLAKGIDLHQVGSGNLGSTNLYRTLGWGYAVPVALFDIAKGAVPVLIFASYAGGTVWVALLLGFAAIVGHVFSVFVRFKGGKGVATAAGVVLGLAPMPTLVAAAVWALVVRLSGYVSLGSISAAVVLPVAVLLLTPELRPTIWLFVVLGAFVVVTHRANIKRLLAGTESRFGRRATGAVGEP